MSDEQKQKVKDYQKKYRENIRDYQKEYQKKYREVKKLNKITASA